MSSNTKVNECRLDTAPGDAGVICDFSAQRVQSSNAKLNERRLDATPRGVGVMCDFYAQRAENSTLWDVEGNEIIDFASGIAVLNTGHRHPKVVAAIEAQLKAFTHTAYQVIPYEGYVSLAERINKLVPIAGPCKTAFFTTGAEAVENAVKIARAHTGATWFNYLCWWFSRSHIYDYGANWKSRPL